jgi:hypothetical protein
MRSGILAQVTISDLPRVKTKFPWPYVNDQRLTYVWQEECTTRALLYLDGLHDDRTSLADFLVSEVLTMAYYHAHLLRMIFDYFRQLE